MRALERTPIFADVGSDALRLLAFSTETLDLPAGGILFQRGDPAPTGFAVMRGRIKLGAGEKGGVVAGPGALIGEMALLVETERPCDAVALEAARVLTIPRPLFRRMLEEFPAIAEGLRAKMIARLRTQRAELERIDTRLGRLPGGGEG